MWEFEVSRVVASHGGGTSSWGGAQWRGTVTGRRKGPGVDVRSPWLSPCSSENNELYPFETFEIFKRALLYPLQLHNCARSSVSEDQAAKAGASYALWIYPGRRYHTAVEARLRDTSVCTRHRQTSHNNNLSLSDWA